MTDIIKVLKSKKKLAFGRAKIEKLLQTGKLDEIFLAANFPDVNEIKNLAGLSKTPVTVLKQTNDEMGALCKKPFSISIIGLIK